MIVTQAGINFFFTGLQTIYSSVYLSTPTWYNQLCTIMPSSTETQKYGWMGRISALKEWTGPRETHSPALSVYSLDNQLFEKTVTIDKFKLADDTYGLYSPMAAELAMQAKKWPDHQMADLLLNTGIQTGTRQNGLDGLAHWSASHPVNPFDSSLGTYVNDFGASGTSVNGVTVGGALSANAFSTVWQEMASRKGEDGKVLGVQPNLMVVPPQLVYTAKTILEAEFIGLKAVGGATDNVGATTNVLRGQVDILVIPELASAPATWYLLDTSRPIKPFIWQQRQAANFVYRINEQDPAVFDNHSYIMGVDARGAPGWSHAWLSSRSGV